MVEEKIDGEFYCMKCNTAYSAFKYHALLNMTVQIGDDKQKVVCFNDTSLKLLKMTGKEFEQMIIHGKSKIYDSIDELCGKLFSMEIKVNKNSSNGQPQFIMANMSGNEIENRI